MASEVQKAIDSVKEVRLTKDLALIEEGLKANEQEEVKSDDGWFKKLGKNMSNSSKKNRTEKLNKSKENDTKALEDLKAKDSDATADEAALKKTLGEKLPNASKKLAFEVLYLNSDTNEYEEGDKTREAISTLIADKNTALADASKTVDAKYNKVSGGFLSSFKASDAVKLGIEAYLLAENKEGSAVTLAEEAVSKLDGSGNDKAAATLVAAFLLFGENGRAFAYDESKNDNICYVLKSEDLASALALKVALFEADKPALKPEEVTAEIKAILKGVNALTFAFEVALMIEKKDQDNVQKKLSITNRFIEALAEILR
ncbi:MAG: hypothetical protein PUA93_02730 [Eubacteriales bacterium]|nr:hypothetical protein [Eubacteriales bacterium]